MSTNTFDQPNFDLEEQNLQAQLDQVRQNKAAALEEERKQKLGVLSIYEQQASGYRAQAERATNDSDKRSLYRYAQEADEDANALRAELGLETVAVPENPVPDEKLTTLRQINSLLLKALFALGAFMLTDFTASKFEVGFIPYSLKIAAQISFILSVCYGGCWLVCTIFLRYASPYLLGELANDFRGLEPKHKLLLLAVCAAGILHFLASIVFYGV